MKKNFCFELYKSISPKTAEVIIPVVDLIRKFKNKPPIPLFEKLAKFDSPNLQNKTIMLHAVSVGEVLSLENLVKKIKTEFPSYSLVITTGTVTGQEQAHKKYSEYADFITYFPLDIYKSVNTFLDKINPSVVLMAETELWPNFAYSCKERNIPIYVINGRISDHSYPSYLKLKGFFKFVLNLYSGIFCQSELDKSRFIELGAEQETCQVMKNLKFEIQKKVCDIDLKKANSKVFIAASTHKGEDEIAFRAFENLRNKNKNIKMILAPRHLTRLDEIKKILKNFDFKVGYRTQNDNFQNNDLIVLDTLGELSKIYEIVDVAYIGGSFNQTGGHNPLEATIYSKPTVSGPSIKNFRDIYSILCRDGASFVVKDEKEFNKILEKLFTDEAFYAKSVENSLNCFNNQQGALEFVISKLKELL